MNDIDSFKAPPKPPPLPGDPDWPQLRTVVDDRPLPAYWPHWARRNPWLFSTIFALDFGALFAGFFRFMNGWSVPGSFAGGAVLAVVMFVTTLRRINKPPWNPRWARQLGMDIRRQPTWVLLLPLPAWLAIGLIHLVLGIRDHRPVEALWGTSSATMLTVLTCWGWIYKRHVINIDRAADAPGAGVRS
jgi:hypothetical protein